MRATDPIDRGPWERFLVLDQESVAVAAGDGFTAAMCFENGRPHAVEVRFTEQGPQIVQAWRADLDRPSLLPVPPESLNCPDLQAQSNGPGSTGAITTPIGHHAVGDEDCGELIDISGLTPVELPYRTFGGCMINGDDIGLSVVQDLDLGSGRGWIQLEAFLGWDYSGAPLWRILDSQSLSDLDSISFECWTVDGTQAVATVEGPITDPQPTAAWTVDSDRLALIASDPSTVNCEYVGD